jgi:hypothetical protein
MVLGCLGKSTGRVLDKRVMNHWPIRVVLLPAMTLYAAGAPSSEL